MVHRLNYQWLAPFGPGKCLFGRFFLRLSMIKRYQVMSMVKFSPIALNFGFGFVLLVHFFGYPVEVWGVSTIKLHRSTIYEKEQIMVSCALCARCNAIVLESFALTLWDWTSDHITSRSSPWSNERNSTLEPWINLPFHILGCCNIFTVQT